MDSFHNDNRNFYQQDELYEEAMRKRHEQEAREKVAAEEAERLKQQPKRKRPKKISRILTAAAMFIMMLLAGFGGGYLAGQYTKQDVPISNEADAGTENNEDSAVLQTTTDKSDTQVTGDVSDIVEKAADSVVEIDIGSKKSPFSTETVKEGAGSGVIVTKDGYIVTNYHVVDGAEEITVRLNDGTEYKATLIGTDKKTDLAILKIEATGLTPVTFADSDAVEVGEIAVAIGNPLGELGGTVTSGIVSAKEREVTIENETMSLLQTSAAVSPGNSGGGLFDKDGNLIGIVNAKSAGTGVEGLAFAIPSNTVREITEELVENGYIAGRPRMGVSVTEITDAFTAKEYGIDEPGVYIMEAENAAFQTGDRIISIAGTEVESVNDISTILKDHKAGETISVVVKRNGAEETLRIVLLEDLPEAVSDAA